MNGSEPGTSDHLMTVNPSSQYHRSWTSAHGNVSPNRGGGQGKGIQEVLSHP